MTNEAIKEEIRNLYHLSDAQIQAITKNVISVMKKQVNIFFVIFFIIKDLQ